MPVAPSAQDPTAVYSSRALVMRYLPVGALAATSDTTQAEGKVLASDLTDLIRKWSRKFDSAAGRKGFEVPFPDIGGTDPRPPDEAVDWVTDSVVAECRAILKYGNRKTGTSNAYREKAMDDLETLLDDPNRIGVAQVSTPELLTRAITTAMYGEMIGNLYRLANRNVIADSLRFVNSAGVEVFRPDGYPFSIALGDYAFHSQAEGLIWLFNEASILDRVGASGGVVYKFSWRKLDWGQSHETSVLGVSRL